MTIYSGVSGVILMERVAERRKGREGGGGIGGFYYRPSPVPTPSIILFSIFDYSLKGSPFICFSHILSVPSVLDCYGNEVV